MGFTYFDRGDHETYIPALQGGSFCRVQKLNRFFGGLQPLYPCLGSDFFRVDSQVLINSAGSMGDGLTNYAIGEGVSGLSPVGIIEDENSEHGRYFALEYRGNVELDAQPFRLLVYDSPYDDELSAVSTNVAWLPPFSLSQGAERGMRTVNLGLVEEGDSSHRSYLYYLDSTSGSSTLVYSVALPDVGEGSSTAAPQLVIQLDFVARSRIYVVPIGGDRVAVYVGNWAKATVRKTLMFVHDPVTNTLVQTVPTLIEGSLPFPQSYAACKGRGDEVHLFLEPTSSWLEGAGTRAEDTSDTDTSPKWPATFDRHSGNAWTLLSLSNDGTIIQGRIPFSGADIQPWMGASSADSMGGSFRASVIPSFLQRQAPAPDKFKESWANVPANDTSFCYTMFGLVGMRTESQEFLEEESAKFVQREHGEESVLDSYGNSRATSGVVVDEGPLTEATASRTRTNLLVPGSVLIEPLTVQAVGGFSPLCTIGLTANRLDSWRLDDNSAVYGRAGGGTTDPSSPLTLNSKYLTASMAIGGVKSVYSSRVDKALIVGWFIGGIELT